MKSKLPKIIFRFSEVYNLEWRNIFNSSNKEMKYPKDEVIKEYIKEAKPLWEKIETDALKEMSDLTNLEWDEDEIICYVVGWVVPFADPLTVPIYQDGQGNNLDYFVDVLTHELIHRLQSQDSNSERMEKYWRYLDKRYSQETFDTRVHIPIHAIHAHMIKTFFDDDRLDFNIRMMQDLPDYKTAWDIVTKEGYKNIIKEFKGNLS